MYVITLVCITFLTFANLFTIILEIIKSADTLCLYMYIMALIDHLQPLNRDCIYLQGLLT